MATEIRVPTLGESVTEATVGQWFKKSGDAVAVDEPLVELETDKVTIEVPAPSAGVLSEIVVNEGDTVEVFFFNHVDSALHRTRIATYMYFIFYRRHEYAPAQNVITTSPRISR